MTTTDTGTSPDANSTDDTDDTAALNQVLLRGRVSTAPQARELPSGSRVVGLRLSVARDRTPMTRGSRQQVDWVDLSAWGAAQRRSVGSWREGDLVEVEGALRRRTSRGPEGLRTRLEVEVLRARMVSRAR